MISSMTAFIRQQSQHDWGTLIWEIRSVNHRYLEPGIRLPDALRHLEGKTRELLRNTLTRGKIEATLKFTPNPAGEAAFELDEILVRQLARASQDVRHILVDAAPVNPLEVLKWPGVIQEAEPDTRAIEDAALRLFQQALEGLKEQRRREGGELEDTIRRRLTELGDTLGGIRKALPDILEHQRRRIRDQFEELRLDVDPSRLEQEITLVVQKADINEELDRLETHAREVDRVLSENGSIGRRLDFLMQELNREANTICSKAAVTETTHDAVELKVLIEQMREQIQNIE